MLYVHPGTDTCDLVLPGGKFPVHPYPGYFHGDYRVTNRSISVSHGFGVACGNRA